MLIFLGQGSFVWGAFKLIWGCSLRLRSLNVALGKSLPVPSPIFPTDSGQIKSCGKHKSRTWEHSHTAGLHKSGFRNALPWKMEVPPSYTNQEELPWAELGCRRDGRWTLRIGEGWDWLSGERVGFSATILEQPQMSVENPGNLWMKGAVGAILRAMTEENIKQELGNPNSEHEFGSGGGRWD